MEETTPAEAATELLRRRAARRNLIDFTTYTKSDYQVNWHHRLLAHYLDLVEVGEITRLMVFMPPQNGKTELVSKRFPAKALGSNPDLRFVVGSYNGDRAIEYNRAAQRIIDSDSYRVLFPDTQLEGCNVRSQSGRYLRNTDVFEVVDHAGSYRSVGRGQGITGFPADILVIDDPLKGRAEADSPATREECRGWYNDDLHTRLAPGGRIVFCATRWHPEDLPGYLLQRQEDEPTADRWTVLRLPAIAEEPFSPGDKRKPGEPLWPDRYNHEALAAIQATEPRTWGALYQQRPRPEGGTEWPESYFGPGIWFEDWPADLVMRSMALDPSKGKDWKYGCFAAWIQLGLDSKGTLWCEAFMRQNWPVENLIEDGVELARDFHPEAVGIEANVFQELLCAEFTRVAKEHGFPLPVVPITNMAKKEVRIRRLGPYLRPKQGHQQGQIRFRNTRQTRILVQQLRDFPLGEWVDGPDALEMAVRMMQELWHGRKKEKR